MDQEKLKFPTESARSVKKSISTKSQDSVDLRVSRLMRSVQRSSLQSRELLRSSGYLSHRYNAMLTRIYDIATELRKEMMK